MRRYRQLGKMRLSDGRSFGCPVNDVNHPETGEPIATPADEERAFCAKSVCVFVTIPMKRRGDILNQRDYSLFRSLAAEQNLAGFLES